MEVYTQEGRVLTVQPPSASVKSGARTFLQETVSLHLIPADMGFDITAPSLNCFKFC